MTDQEAFIVFARCGLPKRHPNERRFSESRRAVDPGPVVEAELIDPPKNGQYLPVLHRYVQAYKDVMGL